MKKNVNYLFILAVLVGITACGNNTNTQSEPNAPTWQEQYDLGVRYLSEGNYEEAIIAFTAAIEIDPKQAEAYVGRGDAYVGYAQTLAEDGVLNDGALEAYENAVKDYRTAIRQDKTDASVYQKAAEVYVILGDMDSAAELIEKGLSATEDQSLQDFLDKLAGVVPADSLAEGSAERQALEDFLLQFDWYGDYDCETAAVPTANGEWSEPQTALEKMLTDGTCYTYNGSLYPGEPMIYWGETKTDPMGRFDAYNGVNANKLHWVLEHIFNCSPKDIETMKAPILAGEEENIYYWDGYYYFGVGGVGGPGVSISITSVEPVGMRYYVEYYFLGEYDQAEPEFRCATVSLKEIDGVRYWTLYNDQLKGLPCGDNLTWTLQPWGQLTISGTGVMMDFNPYSFSDVPAPPWTNRYITSIVIEDGVTSIGAYAFWNSEYLTSVDIPDSVTSIGDNAFWGCQRLTDITIPNRVTNIGDYAFQACGFTEISIPGKVGKINNGVFAECQELSSVIIAEGVTSIGLGAFDYCFNLQTLTIPRSMVDIDNAGLGRSVITDIYYGGSKNEWERSALHNYFSNYVTIHYNS